MWKTTECSKATVFYVDDSHKTENAMETLERSPKRWNQHTTNTNTCARQCIGCVGLALFIFRRVCVCSVSVCIERAEKKNTFARSTVRRSGEWMERQLAWRLCMWFSFECVSSVGPCVLLVLENSTRWMKMYVMRRIASLLFNEILRVDAVVAPSSFHFQMTHEQQQQQLEACYPIWKKPFAGISISVSNIHILPFSRHRNTNKPNELLLHSNETMTQFCFRLKCGGRKKQL